MDSANELFAFAKGVEYLIAIAFVIGFIAFWQLVYGKGKGLLLRTLAIVYLAAGPAILAVSLLATVRR